MGDFYFSVNNAAASKEKSLFPPLRCAASSKGKASQWGERPVWEWSGGLQGGGGHPKMYSNTHHADPDLGNIIKYWNRTKNDPDALKKKSRSVALLAQRAVQVSFPLPGTRCSSPSPDQQWSELISSPLPFSSSAYFILPNITWLKKPSMTTQATASWHPEPTTSQRWSPYFEIAYFLVHKYAANP